MYYYLINVMQLNWTNFSVTISVTVTSNKSTLDILVNTEKELPRILKQHQDVYDKYQEQVKLNQELVAMMQASGVVLKRNKNTDELQGMVH